MKKIKDLIVKLAKEGLFHVFGSSVVAKLGGIITMVVVVRNLPKAEYGNYVSAENFYSYVAIFVGFGLAQVVLQFCSERIEDEKRNATYKFCLKAGMRGNFLLVPIVLCLAAWKYFSGEPDVAFFLALLCGMPFFEYIDHYFQYVLRVKSKNKEFGKSYMIYTAVHVSGNIVMTLIWGVPGLIVSQYLSHVGAAVYSAYILKKDHFFSCIAHSKNNLPTETKKEYLSYSLLTAITNFASTALVLLDVTCLGLILNDAEILADYKVASTIPSALFFVPKSLMTFFFPKLVQAFSDGIKRGFKEVIQLSKIYIVVNGAIFVALMIAAPLIIWIMYGEKYMNTVPVFRVLGINFFVYAFKNLTTNTITVLKKVKANLVFSVLSGVLNIALNYVLITSLGSIGAAVATLIVTICIAIMNTLYLVSYYRKNKKLQSDANSLTE